VAGFGHGEEWNGVQPVVALVRSWNRPVSDVLSGRQMQYYDNDDFRDDGVAPSSMIFQNDHNHTIADHSGAEGRL
jgi:hypothetical protein